MVRLNKKFQPLYTSNKRYFILTGGRAAAKSFHSAIFLCHLLYEAGHKILFTRYTMVSADISIIPEFKQKIELLNAEKDFIITDKEITNIKSGSSIIFRGIKTSAGIQTAALKSIQGITTWVIDEAEELPDEETFDKIDMSIREKSATNRVILILNPTIRTHWIWQKFFKDSYELVNVAGYNVPHCTRHDVCHIHTTYLDNLENISDSILQVIEDIKLKNKKRYEFEIIGGWKLNLEGTLFERDKLKRFSMSGLKIDLAEARYGYIDIADEGADAFAFPIGYIYRGRVFIVDFYFSYSNLTITQPAAIARIKKHNLDAVRVESNNQGSVVIKNMREEVSPEKIWSATSTTNKHTRILNSELFVMDYVYFLLDSEIESGSDYDLALQQICNYNKDIKENDGKDDAPDALSGLTKMVSSTLSHLFP